MSQQRKKLQEANFGQATAAAIEQLHGPSPARDAGTEHRGEQELLGVFYRAGPPSQRGSPQFRAPQPAPAQGKLKCSMFSSSPRNTRGETAAKSRECGGTPTKALPLPGGDLGAEKGEGARGDSEGGSSRLSKTLRCAQHRWPRSVALEGNRCHLSATQQSLLVLPSVPKPGPAPLPMAGEHSALQSTNSPGGPRRSLQATGRDHIPETAPGHPRTRCHRLPSGTEGPPH